MTPTDATTEQLAMARRIAAVVWEDTSPDIAEMMLAGEGDHHPSVASALAAIIETSDLAAKLVENWNRHPSTGLPHETSANIAERIERGDHLKGQS